MLLRGWPDFIRTFTIVFFYIKVLRIHTALHLVCYIIVFRVYTVYSILYYVFCNERKRPALIYFGILNSVWDILRFASV